MGFEWPTADQFQIGIYIAAFVIAVVRLVTVWTIGWRNLSRKGTVVVRLTPRGRELDDERVQYAVSCPAHSDAYRSPKMPEAMSYLALNHLAVTPDKSGTRHWTYQVHKGERLGWIQWIGRILKFSFARRFREPDIGTCPAC